MPDAGAPIRDKDGLVTDERTLARIVLPPPPPTITVGARGGDACGAGTTRLMDKDRCNSAEVHSAVGLTTWGGAYCYQMRTVGCFENGK
jgi:hypothetical protein